MVRALLTISVAAFATAGCSGAPLGGGAGGSKGSGGDGPPCTTYTGCGTGAGGINGSGGGAGRNGPLCQQLSASYASSLTAALACTVGAPNQCQALVATYPTVCPGSDCSEQEYVNDGTTVEAVRQNWLAACEPGVRIECIEIACAPPLPPSVCVPTGGGGTTTGTCVPSVTSDGGSTDGGNTDAALDGGESCDQLAADYIAAVTAAQACTPGAPSQCGSTVSATVSACAPNGCGPEAYVNDATGVNAVRTRWLSRCGGGVACPKIVCLPLAVAVACVPVDGGAGTTTGTCVAGVQPTN